MPGNLYEISWIRLLVLWIRIQWIRVWIQHFKWLRIRIRIQGFDEQKLKQIFNLEFFLFLVWLKITIYLSLGLHTGRPGTRELLQPSKRTSSTSKDEIYELFSIFLCPLECGSGSGSRDPTDPDPQHCSKLYSVHCTVLNIADTMWLLWPLLLTALLVSSKSVQVNQLDDLQISFLQYLY